MLYNSFLKLMTCNLVYNYNLLGEYTQLSSVIKLHNRVSRIPLKFLHDIVKS